MNTAQTLDTSQGRQDVGQLPGAAQLLPSPRTRSWDEMRMGRGSSGRGENQQFVLSDFSFPALAGSGCHHWPPLLVKADPDWETALQLGRGQGLGPVASGLHVIIPDHQTGSTRGGVPTPVLPPHTELSICPNRGPVSGHLHCPGPRIEDIYTEQCIQYL